MLIKSEKQLLNFVKYSPFVVIFTIGLIVNALIYYQNELNYEKDMAIYEKNFIDTNKNLVKIQVEKVYKQIVEQQENLENELKDKLKKRVDEAYSIVDTIYKEYSHKDKKEIFRIIKSSLRNLRFNENRGYFYIYQMDGINVLHPIKPEFEGKQLINFKDKRDQEIIKQTIAGSLKYGDFFKEIFWVKPNDLKQEYKKITFNKYHKELDIFIGTGEYLEDFTIKIKSHMLEYIQNIFYGKNGYIFVFDYEGVQLAHIKKSYIGQNRIDLTDANGKKITQTIINKAKEGSGFVNYIGTIMPQTGKPAEKFTYVQGLDEWKWAIASGFYNKEMLEFLEEKAKELKELNNQSLKKTLMISFFLTIALIFLATYISNILKRFFDDYNDRIQREIIANRKKDVLLHQQSKMASMGEMIGNIAHQWRQPLNMISTATSRVKLEDEFGTLTKESHAEALDAILKSTDYLSKTIDDFREFFNPNKILHEISTEALYNKVMQLTSSRYKSKDIHIESDIEDINVMTYENELIQSLINILNNAVDILSEKELDEKLIFFKVERAFDCDLINCKKNKCEQRNEGGCVKISVTDNAGGIPEKNIAKVFDAYFTTKHQSQGTGIGLYMTYQIVTNHLLGQVIVENKSFEFKNKKYVGASFSIILPLN